MRSSCHRTDRQESAGLKRYGNRSRSMHAGQGQSRMQGSERPKAGGMSVSAGAGVAEAPTLPHSSPGSACPPAAGSMPIRIATSLSGTPAPADRQQRHAGTLLGHAHCRQVQGLPGLRIDPLDDAGLGRQARRLRHHARIEQDHSKLVTRTGVRSCTLSKIANSSSVSRPCGRSRPAANPA